jgi:hypothetical protein
MQILEGESRQVANLYIMIVVFDIGRKKWCDNLCVITP